MFVAKASVAVLYFSNSAFAAATLAGLLSIRPWKIVSATDAFTNDALSNSIFVS